MNSYNPLSILKNLDSLGRKGDLFNSVIDDIFHFHGFSPLQGIDNPNFSPLLDVIDGKDKTSISIEIPGIDKKNIHIDIDEGVLIIKGEKKLEQIDDDDEHFVCERCFGSFRREMKLPSNADADNISAEYKDGILKLAIPKIKEKEKKTKTVTIS